MNRSMAILVILVSSSLGYFLNLDTGLAFMFMGSLLTLALLYAPIKTEERGQPSPSRAMYWWIWAVHLMALTGIYMATYGVANIVGSGRKHSARMAVSTLRTLHWAERQCVPLVNRPCRLSEMNGQSPPLELKTVLLRPEFKKITSSDKFGEVARVGQYHFTISPISDRPTGWVAYAWPVYDETLQSFCLDDHEEIMELPVQMIDGQRRSHYLGLARAPLPVACLGSLHQNPNPPLTSEQSEAIARGAKPPPPTHIGGDQLIWERWRGKRTRYSKSLTPEP